MNSTNLYIPFIYNSLNFQNCGIFSNNLKHFNFFFFECFLLCIVTWYFFSFLYFKYKIQNNYF